jgi:hypothetical protein
LIGYTDRIEDFSVSKLVQDGFPGSISRYEVRDQLNRILQSRHFLRAKKKSRFLEFMCEQVLAGKTNGTTEYAIGVDIYERGSDFNPQEDSIVRVQAHEIRKSLVAYYADEGQADRLRIEVPTGGYIPSFSRIQQQVQAPEPVAGVTAPAHGTRNRVLLGAGLCACVLAGWILHDLSAKAPQSNSRVGLPADAAWFWQPFLPPAQPTLIVLPVHPLLRTAHAGDSPATWKKGQLIDKEKLPKFRDTIHFRQLPQFRFVASTTDFTAVGESLGLLKLSDLLTTAGQKVQAKAGRLVDFEAVKNSNTILLGGSQSWSGRIFLYKDGFELRNGVVSTEKPLAGEKAIYAPEFDPVTGNLSRDYALVMMLPNERRDRRVLLIYGIYTQGSQAAIDYVTNAERLAELRKLLASRSPDGKSVPSYFQVLLSTTVENYVPGKTTLVSARIIPE